MGHNPETLPRGDGEKFAGFFVPSTSSPRAVGIEINLPNPDQR